MDDKTLEQRTNHIPSSVFFPEQQMWLEILKDLPGRPLIVDFGTGHGKSAASLALACPQGTVVTFDPGLPYINAACSPEQYEQETIQFMRDAGVDNFIFTRESSLEKSWCQQIDVLNIDSDHTYETSLLELKRWVPFLKTGGIMFMHDWEHPRCPGVRKALDEVNGVAFNLSLEKVTDAGAVKCAFFIKR